MCQYVKFCSFCNFIANIGEYNVNNPIETS